MILKRVHHKKRLSKISRRLAGKVPTLQTNNRCSNHDWIFLFSEKYGVSENDLVFVDLTEFQKNYLLFINLVTCLTNDSFCHFKNYCGLTQMSYVWWGNTHELEYSTTSFCCTSVAFCWLTRLNVPDGALAVTDVLSCSRLDLPKHHSVSWTQQSSTANDFDIH